MLEVKGLNGELWYRIDVPILGVIRNCEPTDFGWRGLMPDGSVLEVRIAAGGRGSGRFAYAQKVPQVVALVRELHGKRQSLRHISKTLAAQGHLTGGGKPYTATAVQKMLRGG
jgi:hypothetical protein